MSTFTEYDQYDGLGLADWDFTFYGFCFTMLLLTIKRRTDYERSLSLLP